MGLETSHSNLEPNLGRERTALAPNPKIGKEALDSGMAMTVLAGIIPDKQMEIMAPLTPAAGSLKMTTGKINFHQIATLDLGIMAALTRRQVAPDV